MLILRRKHRGFTLTEIMVVITIIALVIGIAIPNYLRMKANASSAAAIKTLRALSQVFEEFWLDQNPHRYPTSLSELDSVPAIQGSPKYINETLTTTSRYQGYYFSVITPDTNSYSIQATPTNPTVSGLTIYAVAGSGNITTSQILVCHSGDTEDKFTDYNSTDAAGTITLPPGHPRNSAQIPLQ